MNKLLRMIGRGAGVTGILLCLASALTRITGVWSVAGFQVGTVFQAGMAAMIVGCLAFLVLLVDSRNGG